MNSNAFTVRIRTTAIDAVAADLRTLVRALDPQLPWLSLQRGDQICLREAGPLRHVAFSLGGFGLLALAIAASGLYAVMAFVVTLRRREIGLRMAIGADTRQIVTLVLRQAFTLVLSGGAVGIALALPLGFGLRSVFLGVESLEPSTVVPAFGLLLAVALIAAAFPARRAAAIDPIATLRQE